MSPQEEWEASLLGRAREGFALSDEERGRHLARLESNLAGGITASVARDPRFETSALTKQVEHAVRLGAPEKGWLWQVHPLSLLGGGLVGGLVVGGIVGAFAAHKLLPQQPPLTPVSTPQPSEEAPKEVAITPAPPREEGTKLGDIVEEKESDTEHGATRSAKPKSTPPNDKSPAPTFYEELSYLRRAQAALREGKPSLALGIMSSLDEIQKVGALDVERRVTKALALCALSRPAEARAVSAPVLSKQSHSVYAKRLKESCVGTAAEEKP